MKRLKIYLSVMTIALTAACFLCACGGQETVKFVAPEFESITVDVSDKPEGVYLGDAVLKSVKFDGEESSEKDYLVRENYFIFTFGYYGEAGLGEHTAEFTFDNYKDVSITVTVTDTVAPDYDLPEVKWYNYQAQTETALPEITRNRKYQNYEVSYVLKSREQTVFEAGDGKDTIRPISSEGFEVGEYTYTVSVEKSGQILEQATYNVFVGQGENLFSSENFDGMWTLQTSAYMNMEFDSELDAVKVNKDGDTGCTENLFTSANRRLYISDLTAMKEAFEQGYDIWQFSYYSTLTGDTHGFRIYRRTGNSGGDCGSEYATFSNENLVNGKWTTVKVDLSVLFGGSNSTATELSITVVGENGTSIYFRHGSFAKTDYSQKDFFSSDALSTWILQADANMSKTFDSEKQAVKITRKIDNTINEAQYTSNNNRIYLSSLDYFRKAYEEGYGYFKFRYYSELIAGSGEFTGFRIYGNNLSNQNGYIYETFNNDKLVPGEWTEVTIDLEKFFTDGGENTAGLSLVILGNTDSCIYFSEGRLEKK